MVFTNSSFKLKHEIRYMVPFPGVGTYFMPIIPAGNSIGAVMVPSVILT